MDMRMILVLSMALSPALPGRSAEPPPNVDPMKEALQTGATVAQIFLGYLEESASPEFPGTEAWLKGAGATLGGLDKDNATPSWNSLDPERLITRNEEWWQAFYEVSPADPGLALLHGGSLLCTGDAQRAMLVLRLALNHDALDAGSAKVITSVMQHAGAYMAPSHVIAREGLALHDKGEFDGAIAKYDEALQLWPRNGWALYEKGLSILVHQRAKGDYPPLVKDLFARSRKVDPFQWNAWQGVAKDIPGLVEMQQVARPLWEKSEQNLNHTMTDEELAQLANALQAAEVDDLALITRQLLVQRRGRFVPEDHSFIAKSLRRLVPGDRTEDTIIKLSGLKFKAIRLYQPLEKKDEEKP